MINRTVLTIFLPLFFSLLITFEQTDPELTTDTPITCGSENNAFSAGEEIVYNLQYKWGLMNVKAGEVRFKVDDLGSRYRISVSGKTSSGIEWFYKVRDYYETEIDKKTLLPIQAKKSLSEGSYRLYEKVIFDHDNKQVTAYRGKSADKLNEKVMSIDQCMFDIISMFYTTRNLSLSGLSKGEKFPIRFFMDQKIYPIEVIYGGKQDRKRIKSNGLHKTIMFKPQLIKNDLFPDGGEMNIWVSDDKNRIPLLIESPLSLGSVRAVLKEYSGLRHPIESIID